MKRIIEILKELPIGVLILAASLSLMWVD